MLDVWRDIIWWVCGVICRVGFHDILRRWCDILAVSGM